MIKTSKPVSESESLAFNNDIYMYTYMYVTKELYIYIHWYMYIAGKILKCILTVYFTL